MHGARRVGRDNQSEHADSAAHDSEVYPPGEYQIGEV